MSVPRPTEFPADFVCIWDEATEEDRMRMAFVGYVRMKAFFGRLIAAVKGTVPREDGDDCA